MLNGINWKSWRKGNGKTFLRNETKRERERERVNKEKEGDCRKG